MYSCQFVQSWHFNFQDHHSNAYASSTDRKGYAPDFPLLATAALRITWNPRWGNHFWCHFPSVRLTFPSAVPLGFHGYSDRWKQCPHSSNFDLRNKCTKRHINVYLSKFSILMTYLSGRLQQSAIRVLHTHCHRHRWENCSQCHRSYWCQCVALE